MKKRIYIVLIICMVLLIGACNSKGGQVKPIDERISYIAGAWTDDVYINEFGGIKFTLPVNWYYATNEELASERNPDSFFALLARHNNNRPSLVVMIDRVTSEIQTEFHDAYTYLVMVKEAYDKNYSGFVTEEIQETTLAGKSCFTFNLVRDDLSLMRYYAFMVEDYVFSISVIAPDLDAINEVMSYFSPTN